jgi:3-deoxy-7-phosphoheptulonate synthase
MAVHQAESTRAGAIHAEMTGKDVTECTGGTRGRFPTSISTTAITPLGPRLNAAQQFELAFLIAEELKKQHSLRPRQKRVKLRRSILAI